MDNTIADYCFENMKEGQSFSFEVTVHPQDIDRYAELSGDVNPIHTDVDFAKERGFAGRVVHGCLIASYISRLIGVHCPGENALLQTINLKFLKPVHEGERVRVCGLIDQISAGTNTIVLKVHVENSETGRINVRGKAQVGFTKKVGPE